MATCLSGANKKKKHKKRSNNTSRSYSSPNGSQQTNNTIKYDKQYEWIQQQQSLISRVHHKPHQFLILSQKEIHDTIDKTLNKYSHKIINWHWINGRFEPVIFNNYFDDTNSHITASTYNHNHNHNHTHNHNHHQYHHHNSINHHKKQLLRMNGHYLIKCKPCFRKTMRNEYMTQKDILFLIKYSLKLFIQHRGQYVHQHNNSYHNHEIAQFQSNFKYSKPLLPNLQPPSQHQQSFSTDIDIVHCIEEDINCTSSEYVTGNGKNMDMNIKMNAEDDIVSKSNEAYHDKSNTSNSLSTLSGIPIIRHSHSDSNDDIITHDIKSDVKSIKSTKSKKWNKKKELKQELNRIQKDYRSMLKDYNNLQNFIIRKGIYYDPLAINKENAQHLSYNPYSLPINGKIRNVDTLQLENENLLMQNLQIKKERDEFANKYMLLRNERNRLKTENINLKALIQELKQEKLLNIYGDKSVSNDSNASIVIHDTPISASDDDEDDDDDDEVKMLQRILPQSDNNTFYTELTTLYDIKSLNNNELSLPELDENEYDSEEDTAKKHTSSILDILTYKRKSNKKQTVQRGRGRARSQSNSLLPVNSVFELRREEDVILQNEFDLFRLLIDDRNDEETLNLNSVIKRRRGSFKIINYLGIDALIDHVTSPKIFNIETLSNFLPLILFKASKFEKEIQTKTKTNKPASKTNYALILISRLSKVNRLWQNDDIRQKLQFLSNSFCKHDKNAKQIKNIFNNSYKIYQNKVNKNASNSNGNGYSNDLIIFWQNIMNLTENEAQNVDYNLFYRDPVISNYPPLRRIKVCRELKSANKPILCELWVENEEYKNNSELNLSSHIILKKGDDLRKDYAIMNIFKYMNYIWKKERDDTNNIINGEFTNLSYESSIVKILTFNVVPIGDDFGAIELIANCVPLRHVENLKKDMKNEHFYQLITSAAASYIGSFVMGVRDRHFENILIRVADCTLFHIDFGYCVGETIKFALDASPFGITNTLKDLMNFGQAKLSNEDLYTNKFIPICVDSYMALRKNYKSLIKFAQLAFSYIKKENDIENFIKNRLKIFDQNQHQNNKKYKKWSDPQYVKEWLEKKLMTAPKDNKTKRKNKLRKFLSPTMTDLDKKLNLNQNINDNDV